MNLDAEAQATLAQVFRGLLELEKADARWVSVRRRARLSDITPTPAAARLVTAFTDARLLIQDREQDGERVVEVAHEALLRNWPRTRWRQAQAMLKRLKPTLRDLEQLFLCRSRRKSALKSALLAASLAVVTLVSAFFLWSNSRNWAPWEALDVVGFKLGLHSVVEPEMIEIPAGTFWMGSKEDGPEASSNEKPQREVKVSSFWVGKYEVTFDEYDLFARVTGHPKQSDQGWGRGKQPVIYVYWEEAVAYAVWLSKVTGQDYRLPTETEWEYAARAGTTTRYWWGDDLGHNRANCVHCGSQWDNKQTAPVGSFEANPFGLHDTAGNVWEWTCSAYRDLYNGSESQCASSNEGEGRVLRGGSWISSGRDLRSANRLAVDPGDRSSSVGFRLARGPISRK